MLEYRLLNDPKEMLLSTLGNNEVVNPLVTDKEPTVANPPVVMLPETMEMDPDPNKVIPVLMFKERPLE